MNERVTSEPSSLCGCSRPLLEITHSCTRCGHDLPTTTRFALSPSQQALAGIIADRIAELLESRRSRQKPGKYADETTAADASSQLMLDEEEA